MVKFEAFELPDGNLTVQTRFSHGDPLTEREAMVVALAAIGDQLLGLRDDFEVMMGKKPDLGFPKRRKG